eukprot:15413-Alexandrium_andersonii.AAC.1
MGEQAPRTGKARMAGMIGMTNRGYWPCRPRGRGKVGSSRHSAPRFRDGEGGSGGAQSRRCRALSIV